MTRMARLESAAINESRLGVMLVNKWPKNRCLALSKAERGGFRLLEVA